MRRRIVAGNWKLHGSRAFATRLVSESQERRLSVPEKMGLNVHLMMCSGCRNFSQQIPFVVSRSKGKQGYFGCRCNGLQSGKDFVADVISFVCVEFVGMIFSPTNIFVDGVLMQFFFAAVQ